MSTGPGRWNTIARAFRALPVLVTNGSMTDASRLGSHTAAPPPAPHRSDSWLLWHRLSRGRADFGNPAAFDKRVKESRWESFTVTAEDTAFLDALAQFSGRETGRGGLMTFTGSNWLITIVAQPQPVYRDQPAGVSVWWGYGLFPGRAGNHTPKPVTMCSGREILEEILHHLPFDEAVRARVLRTSTVVPCLMPYITSQFLARRRHDRPKAVPDGSVNLAFIGRFAEVPDDVVFTVEYSVRTAWTAVAQLLDLPEQPPAVYKGACADDGHERCRPFLSFLASASLRGRGSGQGPQVPHGGRGALAAVDPALLRRPVVCTVRSHAFVAPGGRAEADLAGSASRPSGGCPSAGAMP
ncbi:oleate hydratase [Streptomyces bobili]|uniref:oleate hydratase n=1 Tax=Streptomyces bobili TaxID=67280 RepID=UPI003432F5D0